MNTRSITDPIQAGLASGWKVIDASTLDASRQFEADVAIIGTGAGGGVTAEILSMAGLKVLLIEEGPLKSSKDFKMREAQAYPALYQESAARKTKDKAISIMQGRSVGGSTTVNWTSSFRTPPATLGYWQKHFGLKDYSPEALAPWFAQMEQRLHVAPWAGAPNENNSLLRRGAEKLGISTAVIPRNVNGCWNLGYCGMGCPTNAKQSMLVTTIPSALSRGALLLTRTRAEKLNFKGDSVDSLSCVALDADGLAPSGKTITVRARHYVVAGGAINSPGLLLRSNAPDPHRLLGKRTFLHPVVLSAALFDHKVDGFSGAPQSIYSDHFLHTDAVDGPIGYKLEVPPLHPLLFSTTLNGFGERHAGLMRQFPHMHTILALLRDGFHEQSPGGSVELRDDGSAVLDYPITDFVWDGARRALLTMAQIQFEAGAKTVYPVHELAEGYTSWSGAKKAIEALPYKPLLARVVSAHVMGGCTMSDDTKLGVVSSAGRYHGVTNLSVHDGSLFPTSIGANPQLSIYGVTCRLASTLAQQLTGKPAPVLQSA
ncbi:GMC family oxidoreductase [Noviherbaspirillum autotrophicum]|uniref:GMC family oxidoreductase n=1 Tax=Noviherbaspirillum autotrophicum TaxID=709839 RepID=A0A0C2BY36_9BURK|nr:GMC family oxidoreductase [Noviherbaspirillum autotrophicum]KIF82926.1 GMC family oxidoreductase [Noviherbaspirillum autotrophicum]